MSCRPGPAVGVLVVQAVVAILLLPFAVVAAQAQTADSTAATTIARSIMSVASDAPSAARDDASAQPSSPGTTPLKRRVGTPVEPARPSLLVPLYVTFGALQGLDAHSTMRAIAHGAHEANPFVAPFGHNPAALVAMKAATTAGTIVLAERLRRKHPLKAVVMMTAVNVAYAAIVAANYRQ